MNYWLVRAKWGGTDDKTTQFIQNDEWINGYDDKYLDIVNRVEEGDILLLADSSLVYYYAKCEDNAQDGQHITVDNWRKFKEPIAFPAKGAYIKTIVKINNNELIERVKLAIDELNAELSIYIKSINLQNFTLFKENYLEFSSGLNIIIGENGTGKTQLIKLLYALIDSNNGMVDHNENYLSKIEDKLESIFYTNIKNLIRKHETESNIDLDLDKYTFSFNFDKTKSSYNIASNTYTKKALFIPAKEMLSFYTGFRSIYNQTSFDETFYNLANNLGKLVPKNRILEKFEEEILEELENNLGGKIILEQERFYLLEKDGNKREITLVAEGLRRIGTIFHLLANGTIEKGSVLFWDEPESNLNPNLIKLVVDMLIKLSENGIQIFIPTHNYFMIKYFDIRKKQRASLNLNFISLIKENDEVKHQLTTNMYNIEHNAIIDEMENIYLESSKLFYKGNE